MTVCTLALIPPERLDAVRRGDDVVALAPEHRLEHAAHVELVVGDEHAFDFGSGGGHGGGSLPRSTPGGGGPPRGGRRRWRPGGPGGAGGPGGGKGGGPRRVVSVRDVSTRMDSR